MNGRRELTAAVLGGVVAGALALSSGGQTWARVTHDRPAPLPPVDAPLSGVDAAPLVSAAGLVLLAGALALLAVRGLARTAVGLLMVVAGAALAWSGVRALTGGLEEASANVVGIGQGPDVVTVHVSAAWPVLAVVAGVVGIVVGAVVVLRARGWPAMGRRYERSGTTAAEAARTPRPETDEDRAQAAWKALDRGEDPTEPATDAPDQQPR